MDAPSASSSRLPSHLPCRFLREVQRGGGDQEADDGVATQRQLERMLGRKLHLVRQIHKLITLEDSIFD